MKNVFILHLSILMKKIQQIIYFCLINYVVTFPNDLFDELWQTNQSEPQANNKSQPKIKVEPHEEQFDGRLREEFALKGVIKVEHEPHYGAVKVEGTVTIKHESADEFDQNNSKEAKQLSDQNNSTDQNESVDVQQNESKKCKTIEADQQKHEIIQKFREMKEDYTKNRKYSKNEWVKIDRNISDGLGVGRSTIYKWIKKLGLNQERFSDLEKRQILKQFDEIKIKCKKEKLRNISKNDLDEKIAKKLGVCARTIYNWKCEFGLSVRNKKFSELEKRQILKQFDEIQIKCKKAKLKNISKNDLDKKIAKKLGISRGSIFKWKRVFGLSGKNKISDETKIGILKKYGKIKGKNPKMSDYHIADLLKISISSLKRWKAQFKDDIKHL